ncbi:MAG: DNA polymerase III subunit alpha [Pseudomonadota bacterium]
MLHSPFVHLHLHTYYSLLDGAIPIDILGQKAKEYKMPAVAMTDHGNLFAAVEFYEKIQNCGVKPIIGCEMYLLTKGSRKEKKPKAESEGFLSHLVLLCKNRQGYKNLCRLISSSYLEGFYYKPRIDKELLEAHTEGLICLSACLKGEIPNAILQDNYDLAKQTAQYFAQIFPNDRFYLEVQDQGLEGQDKIKKGLIELSKDLGIGLVATNDVHFMAQQDALCQDALLCIQTGKTLDDTKRLKFDSDQFYFKSPQEMSELFSDCPEAISNSISIAERLNLEFDFKTYHFPKFLPPEGQELVPHLEKLTYQGLEERWPVILATHKKTKDELKKDYEDRINIELNLIKSMGFASYFLIVADFINFAKEHDVPVGPGRGSAAGSLVAYCLKITDIDPLVHGLLFERFLNPERISMPDMDIDFCMRRRDKVIEYVSQKYGNVSQIITFGKMKARAAVRDVGRVMGIPYGEVDRIAKLIPATLNMTLEQALQIEPQIKAAMKKDDQINRLIEIARSLEGYPRHASTHAAGVVISDQPLSEFLPLYLGQHDEVVTQFDMKAVEKIGLVKFDFLGLKTLTVIDDTIKLVEKRHNKKIDISALPVDDELVYSQLSQGDTAGIFQLESSGMTDLVIRLKPNVFADLVALVALFRPGPLGSGMVDDFIDRKHGRRKIQYELPQLESILKDTYGVIVYQEQVMQIANTIAGYSLGEADILRRAMGKKKVEEMKKQQEHFLAGAAKNKISKPKAERLFDLIAKFAEYGFNKSHSAAYALLAYQTAYLKFHYPTEFMAALMTSEKDNADKILQYVSDCKNRNIQILPPDVNESERDFSSVANNVIRFGLAAVKNVGEGAIENIVLARNSQGSFKTLFDFCERVDSRKVNKRTIESLIKCGAFDSLEGTRAAQMASLDRAMELAYSRQRDQQAGQARLFDLLGEAQEQPKLEDVPPWPEREMLSCEKETLGFYITGHPLMQYEQLMEQYSTVNSVTVSEAKDKQEVRLGGVCVKLREITTKRGNLMAFVTLEDLKGAVEVVVFSDVYQESSALIKAGDKPMFVIGQADVDGETAKVIANEIFPLEEVAQRLTKSVHFFLHQAEIDSNHLAQLKNVLGRYKGGCPAYLHFIEPEKSETILALPDNLRLAPSTNLVADVKKLFGHNITKFMSRV